MIQRHLFRIEVNVAGKAYSFVSFHFQNVKQSLPELKGEEVKTISFCRDLLTDVFSLIEIIGDYRAPDINKLVLPSIKYEETHDKKHRYFEVMFTLGNLKIKNELFQKFCCNLVLRENETLHTIDNGRFDFEFQALKDHKQYVDIVEGFFTSEIQLSLDRQLGKLSKPIKAAIEKIIGRQVSAVHLNAAESVEYAHIEGDAVLVSSGMVLGSTAYE